MPLWTRFALATALIVAAAVATASTIQSWVARRAVVDQARSGAESLADVIAKAAAFVEEAPRAAEAEIGAQMLTQARLVAEIVGLAEQAGIPRDAVLARLREVADQGAADFLATDATGAAILETDPVTGAFRRGPDRNSPAVAQAFQRLLEEGELSSLVQESRKREGDDLAWKYVGVRGGAEGGLVQVGMEAAFLERLDREIGLRRLVTTVAGGGVREVRFLDARGTPVVTRRIDASGNASDAVGGTSPADEALVREANAIGRPAGRAEGDTFRAAASVRRADGVPVGAVIVAVATDTGPSLTWSQLLAALASALAVGVPAILAVLWMTGRFVRPVIDSTAATDRIAAGDLSIDVPAGGDDETGLLLSSVGRMTDSLREILGRIRVAGTRLATLEGEVSSSLSRQERAVRGFTGTTSDVSGAVAQIAANSEHLLTATGNVTAAAREAARVADEGREGLESMSESMRQLDDAMNAFTRKLSTIRQRASGITAVVTTIAKVADQTNLLSVNATIEAEKAGEAGRGFRIVAQEIRRLADQTALATKDIERMVRDMQSAVSSGTMEMDRFRKEVSSRIEEVAGVSDQLARIVAPVQAVTNSLESVHDGMESQSAGTRQIRDCMERLRSGAGGTAAATEAFTTAMNDIRMSIADLNEEIARFRTEPARLPD